MSMHAVRPLTGLALAVVLGVACGGGGGAEKCDELSAICHDRGDDNGLGEQCHNAGHAGDTAVCAAIYDDCLAYCNVPLPDAGQADAPPTGGADAGAADAGMATFQHQYTLAPGVVLEATADLAQGTAMTLSFTADGALAWNIHTHAAGMTTYLRQDTGASALETITAAAAAEHYLMWTNNGMTTVGLDVTVTLDGAGTVTF